MRVVTWAQTIPVPQDDDPRFGVPYGQIPDLTAQLACEGTVRLRKKDDVDWQDTRSYTHYNVVSQSEMVNLPAALDRRVKELRDTHDVIAVGDSPSPYTCEVFAIYIAERTSIA